MLLAFAGQQPVGIAVCFFGFSTFVARPLLNIHDLAVIPGCRGQGVGRALLVEAEAQARQRGCCKLTLEVQDDNTPAMSLYKKFGFCDFSVLGSYGASGMKPKNFMGDSEPTRFLAKAVGQ